MFCLIISLITSKTFTQISRRCLRISINLSLLHPDSIAIRLRFIVLTCTLPTEREVPPTELINASSLEVLDISLQQLERLVTSFPT